jgi:hypothetical protein
MKRNRICMVLIVLAGFSLALSGCVSGVKEERPAGTTTTSTPKLERLGTYYDFPDIAIPPDMKLNQKKSFVYGTTQTKGGLLVFSGRVESSSLATFFQVNMQKDGWKLINTFKYPNYLLVFTKADRSAAISISEGVYSTQAEVRVGINDQEAPKGPGR